MRMEIRGATTKIESFNNFGDWVAFGGRIITSGDPVEQEKRIKYGVFCISPEKVYSRNYPFFADRPFSPKEQYTLAFEGLVLSQPLERDISGITSSVPTVMKRFP